MAADRPEFAAGLPDCANLLHRINATNPEDLKSFAAKVARSTFNLNIAGLNDPDKRNRYDIDLEDMIKNAHRLENDPTVLRKLLSTAPWAKC